MKNLKDWIAKGSKEYYGKKLNIVQTFADPFVDGCYVVRVETKSENWCFVINVNDGGDFESCMIDDFVELKPKQKITKKLFGTFRF